MSGPSVDYSPEVQTRVASDASRLYDEHCDRVHTRTDRSFAILMAIQWVGGVIVALAISPRTWSGTDSGTHIHVFAATVLGGAILALPVALAIFRPGRPYTRHIIAVGQMLYAALLIHLTGGRIESHFHIFGSLAFLAFYRDWRVLVTASAVVVADHLLREHLYPQSVFGVLTTNGWRWVEHGAWVVFADVFLIHACLQSRSEMRDIAHRRAMLEASNDEIRRARDEAQDANRAKTSFLANVSHEIRTPLNAVIGYAELLNRATTVSKDEQREWTRAIQNSGRHLLSLINDLLDLSKIESGRIEIEDIECSPAELLSETLSLMRVPALEKGLALQLRYDSDIPAAVMTDPTKVRQVVLNLVSNAVKFTEQGGVTVAVDVTPAADMREVNIMRVRVTDTGIGIEPNRLEDVFDAFVQADNSVTRRFGGTGLGLAISRQLCQMLGGDLTVASDIGKGSTFTATFQVRAIGESRIAAEAVTESLRIRGADIDSATLQGVRVLVVDDGASNRSLIRLVLVRAGADVATAGDGREGLDIAAVRAFDVVLMDMQMPVMDGYEATTLLRSAGHRMPIIALTADGMNRRGRKCADVGCDDLICKPIDVDSLLATIRAHVKPVDANDVDGTVEAHAAASRPPVEPLHSTLPADDSEFHALVLEFADGLGAHVQKMRDAAGDADMEQLRKLAHWLKGAGGTVGYDAFTEPARTLERVAAHEMEGEIKALMGEIESLVDRVRAGVQTELEGVRAE